MVSWPFEARLLAEKAHAALWQRFCSEGDGPLPVKLVAVEMTEAGGFGDQYNVKEAPYCMMFLGGQRVYGKRIHGIRMAPRDAAAAKPKVLLVEENPAIQLKLERCLGLLKLSACVRLPGTFGGMAMAQIWCGTIDFASFSGFGGYGQLPSNEIRIPRGALSLALG